jgi:hypothetical protein
MKTKKSLLVVPAIALVFALVFTTCSNGGGGGRQDNSSGSVKFNMTGAKAILATGSDSGNGRAVYGAGNDLLKLLADNTVVSILSGNQEIPPIRDIVRSPYSKDIYIAFLEDWSYKADDGKSINIGSFIHVKEDGTVVNKKKKNSFLHNGVSIISFDKYGNLYFYDSTGVSTSIVYKYNPGTLRKEQIFTTGDGFHTYYTLSPDGDYFIVTKYSYPPASDKVLSLIPTAAPDMAYDIFRAENFNSTYYQGEGINNITSLDSFAIHPINREIYIIGGIDGDASTGNYGVCGLHKLSSINGGFSKDDWQLTTLSSVTSVGGIFFVPDNSVWGIGNGRFGKLLDRNEQLVNNVFSDVVGGGIGVVYKPSASHIYFETYEVISDGYSNNHRLYRFSYDNPGNFEDLFYNVTELNTKNFGFINWDISGNFLYLNAYERNTGDCFSGEMNLTTLAYKKVDGYQNIRLIVGY